MGTYQSVAGIPPKQLDGRPLGAILSLVFRGEDCRSAGFLTPQTMANVGDITVLLVRAGATEWDDAARLQGETDLPLSESGRQRLLHELGVFLGSGGRGIDLMSVLHGPDEASKETASLLARATHARRREIRDLQPVSLGLWEGLREAELLDRHPSAYRQWMEDPASVTPPQGERFADASDRLTAALSRALSRSGKRTIAVVLRPIAHALVRCWLTGRPATELWSARDDSPAFERLVTPRTLLAAPPAPARASA